jgi:hypothetical protein
MFKNVSLLKIGLSNIWNYRESTLKISIALFTCGVRDISASQSALTCPF